jgi:hypothetical protein
MSPEVRKILFMLTVMLVSSFLWKKFRWHSVYPPLFLFIASLISGSSYLEPKTNYELFINEVTSWGFIYIAVSVFLIGYGIIFHQKLIALILRLLKQVGINL